MEMTPREKRRHAAGKEKNEGLQTKPKLLNICFPLTTQNLIGSSMEICQHMSKTRQPLSTLDIITIYRTNNSTEQITRVALVEATKKKAKPATDEVRVENRNHGLA